MVRYRSGLLPRETPGYDRVRTVPHTLATGSGLQYSHWLGSGHFPGYYPVINYMKAQDLNMAGFGRIGFYLPFVKSPSVLHRRFESRAVSNSEIVRVPSRSPDRKCAAARRAAVPVQEDMSNLSDPHCRTAPPPLRPRSPPQSALCTCGRLFTSVRRDTGVPVPFRPPHGQGRRKASAITTAATKVAWGVALWATRPPSRRAFFLVRRFAFGAQTRPLLHPLLGPEPQ